MIESSLMQTVLESLTEQSGLTKLFKPGKIHSQLDKNPRFVAMRLKLHNPYTFTEFELIDKKSGLRFCIHHTKDICEDLKLFFRESGAVNDNSNTRWEFPCDAQNAELEGTKILEFLKSLYVCLLTPKMIKACSAQDYKPVKIIKGQIENV